MADDIDQLVREAEAELGPADPGIEPLPLDQRAKVLVAFLALSGVVAAVSLWFDAEQLNLFNRLADGERISLAEGQRSDDRVATAAIAYLVAGILTTIVFLLWYSRAYRNTIGLGMWSRRFGTRWAVWYWFIPIVALFRPKQVMNDIWRGSDPELPNPTGNVSTLPVSPLIHWWWAVWILSIYASIRIGVSADLNATAEQLRDEAAGLHLRRCRPDRSERARGIRGPENDRSPRGSPVANRARRAAGRRPGPSLGLSAAGA